MKRVINTTKCDVCLFLHKMCCKMVWKFCEIWKFLWELTSRWAKFCEILSHSVRFYLTMRDMACTLFGYWKKKIWGFQNNIFEAQVTFNASGYLEGCEGCIRTALTCPNISELQFFTRIQAYMPLHFGINQHKLFLTRFLSPRIRHLSPLRPPLPPHLPFHNTWKLHTFFWYTGLFLPLDNNFHKTIPILNLKIQYSGTAWWCTYLSFSWFWQ